MNILRNFEAVFVVALGAAVAAGALAPDASTAVAAQVRTVDIATPSSMAVVVVAARRMNAAEKQRSLEDERRLAKQGGAGDSRI